MPACTDSTIDVTWTLGVQLVEIYIAVFLYGLLAFQIAIYWRKYPNDAKLTRYLVAIIWFIESIHTVFCLHMVYFYAVTAFGSAEMSDAIVWSFGASTLLAIFIAAIVQSFLMRRIYILSRNNWLLVIPPAFILFCRVTLGFTAVVLSWNFATWADFHAKIAPPTILTTGISCAAAVDLFIWVTLSYCLQKSRTGSRRTDTMIKHLQVYFINTGCLTMLVSVAIVLTFVLMAESLFFAGLAQVQSKLYANCLLVSLNARQFWSASGSDDDGAISMGFVGQNASQQTQRRSGRPIEVFQSVTKITDGNPLAVHPAMLTSRADSFAVDVSADTESKESKQGVLI